MGEIVCSKELFQESAILLTCKAFGEIADFVVEETPYRWNVYYSDAECDTERLEKEFNNYLIDVTCKLKKW